MAKPNTRTKTKSARHAGRNRDAIAGVCFIAIFLPVFFAGFWLLLQLNLTALTTPLAQTESTLLASAGIPNTLTTNTAGTPSTLSTSFAEFEIVTECTGLVLVLMLAALLIATPAELCPPKRKLAYFAVFAPFLIAFNALRLFLTLYLGTLWPAWFDGIHAFFWLVDSAVVFAVWVKASKIVAR